MWLFLNIFKPNVWLTIFSVLSLAALAYGPIDRFGGNFDSRHGGGGASFYDRVNRSVTAGIRVMGTALSRPERGFGATLAERCLLLVCLWHSVVVCGIFQGQLFEAYSGRQTVANVNTVEELAHSDRRLVIHYVNIVDDVLGSEDDVGGVDGARMQTALERLRQRIVYMPVNVSVYDTVLTVPNVVEVDRLLNYRLVRPMLRRPDGFSRVHILAEYPK